MAFATQPVQLGSGQTYRTPTLPTFSANPSATQQPATATPTPVNPSAPTQGAGSSLDNVLAANPNLVQLLGGSGTSPGGQGGESAGPNPSGGQLGSQSGPIGDAITAGLLGALGLVGGPLGLAASAISKIGSVAQSQDPLSAIPGFDLLGLTSKSPSTLGSMAQNIDINPAAYVGLEGLTPGDLSAASAAQAAAINAGRTTGTTTDPGAAPSPGSGGEVGIGPGIGGGSTSTGGGSSSVGIGGQGFGGGTGGSTGGSQAGPGGEAGTATDLWTLTNPMGTIYNSGTIITRLERREA
jgi:hypothetical protein